MLRRSRAARGRLRAALRHAGRNALPPVLVVAGLQFGSLLTGAVVTETIFSWPGVGRLLIQSIQRRDYPTVQGCVLFIAAVFVVVNAGVDALAARLDPRAARAAAGAGTRREGLAAVRAARGGRPRLRGPRCRAGRRAPPAGGVDAHRPGRGLVPPSSRRRRSAPTSSGATSRPGSGRGAASRSASRARPCSLGRVGSTLGLVAGERGGASGRGARAPRGPRPRVPGTPPARWPSRPCSGPSANNTVIALSAVGWVPYARLARTEARRVSTLDFVAAARAAGSSRARLLFVHVLPNVAAPLVVQATLHLAGAVLAESALSFLGLGVPPPAPSWGAMLAGGRTHILDAPHVVLAPAAAILVVVLATNVLGDALVDRLDPVRRPA